MSVAHTPTSRSSNLGSSTKLKVHIYIDNSNIYIQGAKTYQPGSNQDPVSDPAWRYVVSLLRNVLCRESGLDPTVGLDVDTFVYGSVPPPHDIWLAMEQQDVKVFKFDRSPVTGKEKQVRSEFIIVTGDGDLLPAVEKISEKGFRVHIWSWSSSFSSVYTSKYNESGPEGNIKLHCLDKFKDEFGYKKVRHSDKPCRYGKYCFENVNCEFSHSQEDKTFFAETGGCKPLRKDKECRFGESCKRKDKCPFYHNESERICLTCDQAGQGHGDVGSPEWQRAHGSS
ncbi:uncharacterized protein PV07_05718 [Cladophialophora immunda]|uniref:C3H1-type domain-containing protein n=1 Tax=Cladophialophora immunda TaxID=569365 RepID=A0A0D2CFP4_9EURO|nr:uncharacterized protein PV07_05718 [Cladophialophora immunda]KIW29933.1 hypothetical protein PV07_05718 [Cladophialophora immunda]